MTERFEKRLPGTSYGVHDAQTAAQAGGMTLEEKAQNERFGPPILLVFPILLSCFGRSNCAFLHFASNLARVEAARFARAVMRGRCTLVEKQPMKTKEIM